MERDWLSLATIGQSSTVDTHAHVFTYVRTPSNAYAEKTTLTLIVYSPGKNRFFNTIVIYMYKYMCLYLFIFH